MRKGGGKQKGSAFEREISVDLSRWVSDGAMDDCFWRSSMSGGRSTIAAAKGKRLAAQAGDISCIHAVGQKFADKFFVECKFYADLNYLGILSGTGNLVKFWAEAKKQAAIYNKQPLLVAKQNRMHAMACLTSCGAKQLDLRKRSLLIAPKLDLRIIPWFEFTKYAARPE
jgi:hypothetical protein